MESTNHGGSVMGGVPTFIESRSMKEPKRHEEKECDEELSYHPYD